MINDKIEWYLSQIYYRLVEDDEYPLEDTLLYVEAEEGMIGVSVFKDVGDRLLYREQYESMCEMLYDFWEIETPDKRWARMEFMVRGGTFRAAYIYPDEIDSDEYSIDARAKVLRKYFGDKRDVYPPPPQSGQVFELWDDR